jgi:hypothetical protein
MGANGEGRANCCPSPLASGGNAMNRLLVVFGIVAAVGAQSAAAQQKVTLFGKSYTVVAESRAQTYKNGLKVVLPGEEEGNRKAALWVTLDPGGDLTKDRLFVACPIREGEPVAHQLYMLQGTDANGLFSKEAATLTEYFGGARLSTEGAGRPVTVMHLGDENAGVKEDRNLLVITFSGDDVFRFYDFDSMTGDFEDAALDTLYPGDDDHAPGTAFAGLAQGPKGSVVVFGGGSSMVGVMDPKSGRFFPVLTDLAEITADSPNGFANGYSLHAAFLYAGEPDTGTAEYWVLGSSTQPGTDGDSTEENKLWRLRLTFPADLATAGPLRAEVLGPPQELKGTPLHASDGGVYGMAVGREVAPGLRRLYFADWVGNLYTATPEP